MRISDWSSDVCSSDLCAIVFAAAGMIGAAIGAEIGKAVDGSRLLMLFGLLMIGVGLSMLRKRRREDDPNVRLSRTTAPVLLPRLVPMGLGVDRKSTRLNSSP